MSENADPTKNGLPDSPRDQPNAQPKIENLPQNFENLVQQSKYKIGDEAVIRLSTGEYHIVKVVWAGIVPTEIHKARPFMYGIVYRTPIGKHNGRGIFHCKKNCGSFVLQKSLYAVDFGEKPAKKYKNSETTVNSKINRQNSHVPKRKLKLKGVISAPRPIPLIFAPVNENVNCQKLSQFEPTENQLKIMKNPANYRTPVAKKTFSLKPQSTYTTPEGQGTPKLKPVAPKKRINYLNTQRIKQKSPESNLCSPPNCMQFSKSCKQFSNTKPQLTILKPKIEPELKIKHPLNLETRSKQFKKMSLVPKSQKVLRRSLSVPQIKTENKVVIKKRLKSNKENLDYSKFCTDLKNFDNSRQFGDLSFKFGVMTLSKSVKRSNKIYCASKFTPDLRYKKPTGSIPFARNTPKKKIFGTSQTNNIVTSKLLSR